MKLTIYITKKNELLIDQCLGKKGLVGCVLRLDKKTGIIHLRKYFPSELTDEQLIEELKPVTDEFEFNKIKYKLESI